jgi:hypothetical protein
MLNIVAIFVFFYSAQAVFELRHINEVTPAHRLDISDDLTALSFRATLAIPFPQLHLGVIRPRELLLTGHDGSHFKLPNQGERCKPIRLWNHVRVHCELLVSHAHLNLSPQVDWDRLGFSVTVVMDDGVEFLLKEAPYAYFVVPAVRQVPRHPVHVADAEVEPVASGLQGALDERIAETRRALEQEKASVAALETELVRLRSLSGSERHETIIN